MDQFLEAFAPIAPRTAGLLLRIAPDTPVFLDWFEHLLNRLADIAPLCVDLPENEWRDPEPPILPVEGSNIWPRLRLDRRRGPRGVELEQE